MNFKTGDKVIVIAGKDKDKTGKINKILRKENMVIVEGINVVKRHQKPSQGNQNGGIIEKEAPIHVSNIMMVDAKTGKGTRVGHNIDKKGNKVRISKKSNETIA
jgi:large subunit ribosomal protein L24